jgi:hypothetical protein
VPVLPTCHRPTSVYTLYEYRQPQPLSLKNPISSTRSSIPLIKSINQASVRRPDTTDPSDVRLQVSMPCISQEQRSFVKPLLPLTQNTHNTAQRARVPIPLHPIQNVPVCPNSITELIVHQPIHRQAPHTLPLLHTHTHERTHLENAPGNAPRPFEKPSARIPGTRENPPA